MNEYKPVKISYNNYNDLILSYEERLAAIKNKKYLYPAQKPHD
jgi:hypothetical protein